MFGSSSIAARNGARFRLFVASRALPISFRGTPDFLVAPLAARTVTRSKLAAWRTPRSMVLFLVELLEIRHRTGSGIESNTSQNARRPATKPLLVVEPEAQRRCVSLFRKCWRGAALVLLDTRPTDPSPDNRF